MINLLEEKIEDIKYYKLSINDIVHIGNEKYGMSWSEFCTIANVEYDNGFGSPEVAPDLKIIFKDGTYLRRWEYDGSEGWEAVKPFKVPKTYLPIKHLIGDMWDSLEDLNSGDIKCINY